jgi:hypothetical protein
MQNSSRDCYHVNVNLNLAASVKVVYDTSPGTTTRTARGGSLMEGLRLSTLKQDGHGDLCGLGHQSVIPYVHGEDFVLLCIFFKLALKWSEWTRLLLSFVRPFIVQGRVVTL